MELKKYLKLFYHAACLATTSPTIEISKPWWFSTESFLINCRRNLTIKPRYLVDAMDRHSVTRQNRWRFLIVLKNVKNKDKTGIHQKIDSCFVLGAGSGTWTHTPMVQEPKSCASANSTIPAYISRCQAPAVFVISCLCAEIADFFACYGKERQWLICQNESS